MGPKFTKSENLVQAAPIVSSSFCWKQRISFSRATIRDLEKISKIEPVYEFTPASILTLYIFGVPLSSPLYKRDYSVEVRADDG